MVTKLGGTVDDSEAVPGMVFDQKASTSAGGPTRVENAKIALVQFCISPPKTDLENNVIISDYAQMDRRVPPGPPGVYYHCDSVCTPPLRVWTWTEAACILGVLAVLGSLLALERRGFPRSSEAVFSGTKEGLEAGEGAGFGGFSVNAA